MSSRLIRYFVLYGFRRVHDANGHSFERNTHMCGLMSFFVKSTILHNGLCNFCFLFFVFCFFVFVFCFLFSMERIIRYFSNFKKASGAMDKAYALVYKYRLLTQATFKIYAKHFLSDWLSWISMSIYSNSDKHIFRLPNICLKNIMGWSLQAQTIYIAIEN